jgi:hypothetical protein
MEDEEEGEEELGGVLRIHSCPTCPFHTVNRGILAEHMRSRHAEGGGRTYACPECTVVCTRKFHLGDFCTAKFIPYLLTKQTGAECLLAMEEKRKKNVTGAHICVNVQKLDLPKFVDNRYRTICK